MKEINIKLNFQNFLKDQNITGFNTDMIESVNLFSDEISFISNTPMDIAVKEGIDQFVVHSIGHSEDTFDSISAITAGDIILEFVRIQFDNKNDVKKEERWVPIDEPTTEPHEKFLKYFSCETITELNQKIDFNSYRTELKRVVQEIRKSNEESINNIEIPNNVDDDVDWI